MNGEVRGRFIALRMEHIPPNTLPISLLYDLGDRALDIVKVDVKVNLLDLLQTLLGGCKIFISSRDDTQSLSQLGVRFLDLLLQDLHLLIGRDLCFLDGS